MVGDVGLHHVRHAVRYRVIIVVIVIVIVNCDVIVNNNIIDHNNVKWRWGSDQFVFGGLRGDRWLILGALEFLGRGAVELLRGKYWWRLFRFRAPHALPARPIGGAGDWPVRRRHHEDHLQRGVAVGDRARAFWCVIPVGV